VAEKSHYFPTPCTLYSVHLQPCEREGEGGTSSTDLKICLIKTWVTLKLSSKVYWKWHFLWKPLKQKSLLRVFARHFCFLKIFCFNHPGLIFSFLQKRLLNSQAVRIRVNPDFSAQIRTIKSQLFLATCCTSNLFSFPFL
jgi:hypothetical protein